MEKTIKITALKPDQLAQILSRAGRKTISGQDVLAIARKAGILSKTGTISLIEYAAYLAKETTVSEN